MGAASGCVAVEDSHWVRMNLPKRERAVALRSQTRRVPVAYPAGSRPREAGSAPGSLDPGPLWGVPCLWQGGRKPPGLGRSLSLRRTRSRWKR